MRILCGALAVVLLAGGLWAGAPAFQAWSAITYACDPTLLDVEPGTWVRLRLCAADLFHNASLVDNAGRQTHLVMALRPAGESAASPAEIALAAAPDLLVNGETHRRSIRKDDTQTADVSESLVLALGRLDGLPYRLTAFPQTETGLSSDPYFLELRAEPSRRKAWLLLAAALVAALAAAGMGRQPGSDRAWPARTDAGRPPVRWGLVFVLVLVGVFALVRGIQWYFDATRSVTPTDPVFSAPRATAAKPEPERLPPTRDELAGLASDEPDALRRAIERLRDRTVTLDVVAAVDRALGRTAVPPDLISGLVCLRSRFDGPGSLDDLLARFPVKPLDLREARSPGVACVAAALATRIREDPARVQDALERTVFSENWGVVHEALRGFRLIAPTPIPADLEAEALKVRSLHRRAALAAVVAMGAIRTNPTLVLRGARIDPYDRAVSIADALAEDSHPNAARIVARLVVEEPAGQFGPLMSRREATHHDVSAALLEIVSDPLEDQGISLTGLRLLRSLKEVGPLPGLRQLLVLWPEGSLAAEIRVTITELESLGEGVRRALMRELPPRGNEWR